MTYSIPIETRHVYQGAVLFLPSEDEVKESFEERAHCTTRQRSAEDRAPVTRVISNRKHLHSRLIWGHPILVLSRAPDKILPVSGEQIQEIDFLVITTLDGLTPAAREKGNKTFYAEVDDYIPIATVTDGLERTQLHYKNGQFHTKRAYVCTYPVFRMDWRDAQTWQCCNKIMNIRSMQIVLKMTEKRCTWKAHVHQHDELKAKQESKFKNVSRAQRFANMSGLKRRPSHFEGHFNPRSKHRRTPRATEEWQAVPSSPGVPRSPFGSGADHDEVEELMPLRLNRFESLSEIET